MRHAIALKNGEQRHLARGRHRSATTMPRHRGIGDRLALHLLRQIMGLAHLINLSQLRLEPIDMRFLARQDMHKEILGAVIAIVSAKLDAVIEARNGLHLDSKVELELLGNLLANVDFAEALYIGYTLEKEDSLDELVGMFHLVDRFFANSLGETVITPVFAHLRMKKVLIDGGKLAGEDIVQ
jgi:hypothetical protein